MTASCLAPAIIVRSAAWPTSALDGLGDAALGELARKLAAPKPSRRDREAHRGRRADEAAFETAYAAVLERDRQQLAARTARSPRFVHALWLSNPHVAARLAERGAIDGDDKRARHLQTTLYRYLARAVGRATPCDAWSGVSMARFGARTQLVAGAPRVVLAPDLRPFQALLRALARRPIYRRRERLTGNPTLAEEPSGAWTCWARLPNGLVEHRRIDPHPIADELLRRASASPRAERGETLSAAVCAARPQLRPADVDAVRDTLADHGFLVGGLDLPSRFRSPWHALARAERRLCGDDRRAWSAAIDGLRAASRALVEQGEDVQALHHRLAAAAQDARAQLQTLASALGVEVEIPRVMLRADLATGWTIELGPEQHARLGAAVEQYEIFQRELGLGAAFRRAARAQTRARYRSGLRLDALDASDAALPHRIDDTTWEAIATATGGHDALRETLAKWAALVTASGASCLWHPTGVAEDRTVLQPLGALVVVPHRDVLWIQGVLDEHTMVHARYAWVLEEPRDPLRAWFAERMRTLAAAVGFEVVDYASFAERHPNVAARPLYLRRAIEPWGAGGSRRTLHRLAVELDEERGRLHAYAPVRGRKVVVAHLTSSDVSGDPVARVLLPTSFREAPMHAVQASTVPFEAELGRVTPTPALTLEDGSVARAQRQHVRGEALTALLASTGAARFLRWQAIAECAGLPERVLVRKDGEPPVLLVRDSPLALDAVLEGARDRTRRLMIEVPPESPPWLRDEAGASYVCELAVPFERASHAWSTSAPQSTDAAP